MPGDDGEMPWALERRSGSCHEMDKEEDVGSSDGDDELAEAKLRDQRQREAASFAELTLGAMQSVLDGCIMDADEAEKERARAVRVRAAKRRRVKKCTNKIIRSRVTSFLRLNLDSDDDALSEADVTQTKKDAGSCGARQRHATESEPRPVLCDEGKKRVCGSQAMGSFPDR